MVGTTPCWSFVAALLNTHSMKLFSITTDYAIAATATIDDGVVYGKVEFVPDMAGNINVTINITGLAGMRSY